MLFKPLGTPHDSNRKRDMEMMEHLHVCPVRHMTKNECVVP